MKFSAIKGLINPDEIKNRTSLHKYHDNNIMIWAGQKVEVTSRFNKKKNKITEWEDIYYLRGEFKHIK